MRQKLGRREISSGAVNKFYQEVLKPKKISENKYRLYDDKALEKLQEIMFFKEMDLPLDLIKKLLDNPSLDRKEILLFQKAMLEKKRNRLNEVWHIENARYFLLQLADQIERKELLIDATDKQYGVGVALYMAKAIREYYGVS